MKAQKFNMSLTSSMAIIDLQASRENTAEFMSTKEIARFGGGGGGGGGVWRGEGWEKKRERGKEEEKGGGGEREG